MRTKTASIRTVVRLLLLSILLTTQSLSFAHEVTHLWDGDTGLCEVCRIQGNSPAIASFEQDELHSKPGMCHPLQPRSSINSSERFTDFQPRAPPRFL